MIDITRSMIVLCSILGLAIWQLPSAAAQVAVPNSTAPNQQPLASQGDPQTPRKVLHKTISGKPCLAFEALSRALPQDKTHFEHIIGIDNRCSQRIRIGLCYVGGDDCMEVNISGLEYREIIMNFMTRERDFRYRYFEKN